MSTAIKGTCASQGMAEDKKGPTMRRPLLLLGFEKQKTEDCEPRNAGFIAASRTSTPESSGQFFEIAYAPVTRMRVEDRAEMQDAVIAVNRIDRERCGSPTAHRILQELESPFAKAGITG